MATTKKKAGRRPQPEPSEKQVAGLQKKYREAKHTAELTVQPHMLYARKEVAKLVEEKLSDGLKPEQRTEPFEYVIEDGQLYVKLSHPILQVEAKEIIDPISQAIRTVRQREAEKPGVSERQARKFLPGELEVLGPSPVSIRAARAGEMEGKTAEEIEQEGIEEALSKGRVDLGKILFAKFPLLTLTSKMGCYSFNLPAGPITHGFRGTCPASAFGFPMLEDRERPRTASRWFDPGTRSDGTIDYSKIDPKRWLCSGCYGLKGLYGSPMIFTMMECRKQFIMAMLHNNRDGLVDILVKAIRMGQAQSLTERFFLEQMGPDALRQAWKIPDPAYFRIHDVGDAWNEKYFLVWCDVARELATEHKVKLGMVLPAMKFWMPTRIWMLPGGASNNFMCKAMKRGCVPTNLTVRPSGAHFGDPAPNLQETGLAGGAGSTVMSDWLKAEDIAAAEKVVGKLAPAGNGWICPAYLGTEAKLPGTEKYGGGAEWAVKGKKTKYLELVGGACSRAWGPDGEPPSPKGRGCRACWERPDLFIVYPEH